MEKQNQPLRPAAAVALIRLKDALELLDGPAPVAVRWVKCDVRRKTAGALAHLPAARLGRGKPKAAQLRTPVAGEQTPADLAASAADGQVPVPTGNPKNPAHWANATRNLVDTTTGKLVKIHIYLLTHVAGRKVYL